MSLRNRGGARVAPWTRIGAAVTVVIVAVGAVADTTSLIGNKGAREFIKAVFPYSTVLAALVMTSVALVMTQRARKLESALEQSEQRQTSVMRRLVRVLGAAESIGRVADVEPARLQPLFDELVGALPLSFGAHHKFSIARPNADGTFTLLATRGMDPAAATSIEAHASWNTGRSFYASLLNDQHRSEFRLFSTADTAYIDTRSAGNTAARASSSSSHFLIAMRDEDIYGDLPKNTIGILSIGIPKGMLLSENEQSALFKRVLPVGKAIEAIILAASIRGHGNTRSRPRVDGPRRTRQSGQLEGEQ